jgi:hypothetical protein
MSARRQNPLLGVGAIVERPIRFTRLKVLIRNVNASELVCIPRIHKPAVVLVELREFVRKSNSAGEIHGDLEWNVTDFGIAVRTDVIVADLVFMGGIVVDSAEDSGKKKDEPNDESEDDSAPEREGRAPGPLNLLREATKWKRSEGPHVRRFFGDRLVVKIRSTIGTPFLKILSIDV